MRLYGAIDLHSNNNVLVLLDEEDRVIVEKRLANELSHVMIELATHKKDIEAIAVESTFNWYWLVDGLMKAGYKVKLVNTAAVKVYEGLKYTADEHDARHLAHLMRLGVLPTGYIYPREERAVRDLLRKRGQLVRCRTTQILSVQNMASRNSGHGISKAEIRDLNEETITEICGGNKNRALAIESNIAVMRELDDQIAKLEHAIIEQAKLKPEFAQLMTINGVGKILAMTIMYEVGTITRFEKVGQFASYARCVSSSRWSNGKKKGEGNRKNGNKYLAWAFVEAAIYAVRFNEQIRKFHQRKKAKVNGIVAIKAVAHKLARACYHVLKKQESFDVTRAFA